MSRWRFTSTFATAIKEADRRGGAGPSVTEQPPAATVTAAELYADYKANEVAADQRYRDRVIVVTGRVQKIGKDIVETMYVTLDTGEMLGSVQCMFGKEHADSLAGLSQGESVTIKGMCAGKMMNVLLRGCSLE